MVPSRGYIFSIILVLGIGVVAFVYFLAPTSKKSDLKVAQRATTQSAASQSLFSRLQASVRNFTRKETSLTEKNQALSDYQKTGVPPFISTSRTNLFKSLPVYEINLVFDGNFDLTRNTVKLSNGKEFTILVSMKGYYLDKSNQLQSVVVPIFVEANGIQSRVDLKLEKFFTPEEFVSSIKSSAPRGQVFVSYVSPDLRAISLIMARDQNWFEPYAQTYYDDHQKELNDFINTGDPSIKTLIPFLWSFSADNVKEF